MVYLALSLSLILFMLLIHLLGIVPRARAILADTRSALAVMRDAQLSEEEKETAVQKAALAMFGAAASIIARIAVSLVLPALLVLAGAQGGMLYEESALVAAASDWVFILVASAAMIGAFFILK
ncbi:MAG: hypothetical protein D6807_08650 [Alphaproteobacteria bacterium]|nr:MAG: hypothetical protein D6807_08650 [Alphaproteobacteria bacterium]